jgi:maltooligosyltrehalose trehalohydrolase
MDRPKRSLPIGAEILPNGAGAHFRVWAPRRKQIDVVLEGKSGTRAVRLDPEASGYFSGLAADVRASQLYRYRLDGGSELYPDPASRFQPEGPHGPSQIVDPATFHWSDHEWGGVGRDGQIIYEMHVGTFTHEGTWQAAELRLPELAALGVTVLETMPVAEFPGRFGWGYDGVDLFAPTRLYGTPDDFRHFVDRAHAVGLGVILDVVYNHFGPDGNYLSQFSTDYFTDRYKNEWGQAINFDGPGCEPVRELFISNAGYWVREYHLDGLRLDATQQMFDASPDHILAAIAQRVRASSCGRKTLVVAENEEQYARLVRPLEAGGYGLDALWNDDLHHSAMVALTGKNPAYYSDFLGTAQELVSAVKWGTLYQGQWYTWQKQRRGTAALDLAPAQFITYIQNHDQIANSAKGERCHQLTSPGRYRAMTALLLLAPHTPMLFQGQEFAASSPFLFFADHEADLAAKVAQGRREFLSQFPALALPESQTQLANPGDPATFERCRLDWNERERHDADYALHRDLIKLRREDSVFRTPGRRGVDGAVLASGTFVLRFFADTDKDRLLIVNLSRDLPFSPAPEPLLAPPDGCRWATHWSTEDVRYGGCGTPPLDVEGGWRIPGEAAVVLVPQRLP